VPGGGLRSPGAGRLVNCCFPEDSMATPTGSSWPVGGIDPIPPGIRCVTCGGQPRMDGRSEQGSRLSEPNAMRPETTTQSGPDASAQSVGRRHVCATGGRTLEAHPDTAILLAPGQEFTLHLEPDDRLVAMRMPGSALADELVDRDPAAALRRLGTREIPLAGGRLSALAAMHRALVDATKPKTENASVPRAEQLEARLCSWMADQILGTRPSSSTPALGIQRIRVVEEWIDAHLAEPITLGRLCDAAGVGDRHLESTFRLHRGQTPLQFVMARRLAWVRRSLLESKPGDSVTQLAHDAGYVHLGRFAARYRSTYCESPSATLRRSLSRS
jgi:AraC-like DNA-binding protein